MVRLASNPRDAAAEAIVNTDRFLHSNLRTTCVAMLLDASHAANALPQRAGSNVNCRIFRATRSRTFVSGRDYLFDLIKTYAN
jgi:hypothetical protein